MIRHPPRFEYCGLTIIMSNPSRFDKKELLCATGGWFLTHDCLKRIGINRHQCDIRLAADKSTLWPKTKVVLCLGQYAQDVCMPGLNTTLNQQRGCPVVINGIPYISSYLPQDAIDPKDHESKFNEVVKLRNTSSQEESINDDKDEDDFMGEKSRHGRTKRKNWRFWLAKDIDKVGRLLAADGIIPSTIEPHYNIYPTANEVIDILTNTKDQKIFFDIETDIHNFAWQCFAFCINDPREIYCVPVIDHNYLPAYDVVSQHKIMRALAVAFRDNTIVAHNGAAFDFIVLPWKFGIPIGRRLVDTMIEQHRCYPEVEKSLGHCISLWTYEPYHKDEGLGGYNTPQQVNIKLLYCGKDVSSMCKVYAGLHEHASKIPGLEDSIRQGNASIYPYIVAMLTGMEYDEQIRLQTVKENDRLMMQYLRCIHKLTGGEVNLLPTSNPSCVKYFHDLLQYPVLARSKKTGKPSLGKKLMFSLRLKFNNPVIDFCIAFRECSKESGSLKFIPWKT